LDLDVEIGVSPVVIAGEAGESSTEHLGSLIETVRIPLAFLSAVDVNLFGLEFSF
jgi:hypothetical protein